MFFGKILMQIHLAFCKTSGCQKGQLEITNHDLNHINNWIGNEVWETILVMKEKFYDNCGRCPW